MSNGSEPVLPYGRQLVDDDDIAAVTSVLRGSFLTTGPTVAAFERALAAAVDAPQAVVCSSGTAALHLAALALDMAPGEWVVVPSQTFVATANAVRYVGGEVVFADCDPDSGLMGPEHLDQALRRAARNGERPRAVFPVHLAGQCASMAEVAALAERHDLTVVEDASHAIGTRYGGEDGARWPVGGCRHAAMTVFSFHPVKTVAMGEGGAITTRNEALAERLRRLRTHGIERRPEAFTQAEQATAADGAPNPWYYELAELGFNYRASDIHCALGLSQLAKLQRFVDRRRTLAKRYDNLLVPLHPIVRPAGRVPGCTAAWHLYVVLIDFPALGLDRAGVMRALRSRGIGSQVHYIPVHRQPYYRARYGEIELPGTEAYYARCLSLPLFAGMEPSDVDRVVGALSDLAEGSA